MQKVSPEEFQKSMNALISSEDDAMGNSSALESDERF